MAALFETVLHMSLTASVVIAAVLLVRLLLRRAPKKISYALWSAAGFRLLCPVSFRAVFSLFRILPGEAEILNQPAVIPEPAGLPLTPDIPVVPYVYVPPYTASADGASRAAEQVLIPSAESTVSAPADLWAAFLKIGSVLWLCGAAVMLLCAAVSYVRLKRHLRTAVKVEDGVFRAEGIRSPFLLGWFRPRIYVPSGLEPDTLRYVLCHERIHLKRGDNFWKTLAFAALCVHWFNPLVWLAFRLMTRDMEMSCDERVLAENGKITRAYSMSLLSFAAGKRFPAPSPLAFGEGDVKKRIRNILRWRKPRIWVTVLSALLCLAVVAACTADPKDPREETFEAETEINGGTTAETAVTEESEPEKTDSDEPVSGEQDTVVPRPWLYVSGTRPVSMAVKEDVGALISERQRELDELEAAVMAVPGWTEWDDESAGLVLHYRTGELECVYSILRGDGHVTGNITTVPGHDYSSVPRIRANVTLKTGAAEAEWTWGFETATLRMDLPSLWMSRAYLDPETDGDAQTLDFFGSSRPDTDAARIFTLTLVPVDGPEPTDPGAIQPDPERGERLAVLRMYEGFFQLYLTMGEEPPEKGAEEWARMRDEVPGILTTMRFRSGAVTTVWYNEAYFSPDEDALSAMEKIRERNDLCDMEEADRWLDNLRQAFEKLLAEGDPNRIRWDDPAYASLLDRAGYGYRPFTPKEDAGYDDWWADPADNLREDPTGDNPESLWASVKNDSSEGSFSEKPGIWPAETFTVAMEQGWNTVWGHAEYLLGAILGTPESEPVLASNDGTVVLSDWHDAYGYYVLVDHGGGVCTLYGGLSPDGIAAVGTELKQGDVLGKTAKSTEPSGQNYASGGNLIFEVRYGGAVLNPRDVIDWWEDYKDQLGQVADNMALSRETVEDQLRQKKAEEEARREEEEQIRRTMEEETRRLAEEIEKQRAADEEARQAEEEQIRLQMEEEARRLAEETERRILQEARETALQELRRETLRRVDQAESELVRAEEMLNQARARQAEAENLRSAADEAYESAAADKDLTGDQRSVTLSELDAQRRSYQALCELSAEEVRQAEEALENARAEYRDAVQEDYAASHLAPDSEP
jgi:beta-lactamase regulating signal transducer with metallopeptidase domain/murein DD-endopeptidase MepM/ murein hydrolase activator NlpD